MPVGFKIKEDSPTEIKKGIVVVAPDSSEFVWVPVKDVSKMYGINAEGKKLGKLYDFSENGYTANNWTETSGKMIWKSSKSYREPDYLPDTTDGDAATGYNSTGIGLLKRIVKLNGTDEEILTKWKTQLQNEFDEMIKYVGKNKGFYVGRYETSLNASKNTQSISGVESVSGKSWYELYQKEKEYSEKNKLTNVVGSSMIWGSQYDQMMIWMKVNGINVTSETPKNLEGVITSKNTTRTTGTVSTDKLNNIYDLLGNYYEWILEAYNARSRTHRGGHRDHSYSPDSRGYSVPYNINSQYSSRIALYIK